MPVEDSQGRPGNEALPIYTGMRVEVLGADGETLFEAVMEVINPRLGLLNRTSDLFAEDIPEAAPVTLRGFHAEKGVGVHMEGYLTPLSQEQDKAWMVQDLAVTEVDRGRVFPRAPLSAKGWVTSGGDSGERVSALLDPKPPAPEDPAWRECDVVNASSGGVSIRTDLQAEQGDTLWVRFQLRRGIELPPLECAVRRVTEFEEEYGYGCEFIHITPEVDEVIAKTIIQLQIMRQIQESG